MPEFAYRAVDHLGNAAKGVMSAESELALEARLRGIGYWLIDASASSGRSRRSSASVSSTELIEFYRGMASLLAAGVTAADALQAMVEETVNDSFQVVLEDIQLNLNAGNSIYIATSRHPQIFNTQSQQLIHAGEFSGNLATAFDDLAEHLEWTQRLLSDVKQASLYPAMIMVAVFGLITLMFTFVVPRFAEIFADLGLDLPLLTRGVIAIGSWAENWGLVAVIVIAAAGVGFRFAYRRVRKLRLEVDRFWLKVPVFGEINRMLVLSRFVHNLSLLLAAGVSILEALSLCRGVVGNRVMEQAVRDAEQAVNDGQRVSDALRQHSIVSPLVLRMLVVGEETGNLDESLSHVARRFDEEIPRRIKQAFGIMEPAIMLTLIGVVGLIAGAVFLPMFSLMSGLGH